MAKRTRESFMAPKPAKRAKHDATHHTQLARFLETNQVLSMNVSQISIASLVSKVKMTKQGKFSIIDFGQHVLGLPRNQASNTVSRIKAKIGKKHPERRVSQSEWELVGVTQHRFETMKKDTPVCDLSGLMRMIEFMPKPMRAIFSRDSGEILARYIAGDPQLAEATMFRHHQTRAEVGDDVMDSIQKGIDGQTSRDRPAAAEAAKNRALQLERSGLKVRALLPDLTIDDNLLEIAFDDEGGNFDKMLKFFKMMREEQRLQRISDEQLVQMKIDTNEKKDLAAINVASTKKIKEHEIEKSRLAAEAEKDRSKHIQAAELKRAQAVAAFEIEQKKAEAQRRLEAGENRKHSRNKCMRAPIKDLVLAAAFPDDISARCGVANCGNYVTAFSGYIGQAPEYMAAVAAKAEDATLASHCAVVCGAHGREPGVGYSSAVKYSGNRDALECWVFWYGTEKVTVKCGICGKCELKPWSTDLHNCHLEPISNGGADSLHNRMPGSAACNQSQGNTPHATYCAALGESVPVKPVPAMPVGAVPRAMKALWSTSKRAIAKSCHVRAKRAVKRFHSDLAQQTIAQALRVPKP